ncbi:MAG: MFS transporter [Bacteroidetes bacterium]|mgnify:CR=1 FL=1|jgi:MFS transporter, FHS family, L-fucose permease|nr:MFS transporter [Bacteroidota bacterium]MBT3751459.1 MFS transporter [Bacteroidota bacterium]MBT4399896.1 MFS transporter [Bacteroidota bacterium]MBT4410940.1 MFS transporter [Bacteroidota bacterium]MBT5427401.1 MFS transporter [Bacteroidota bacterium]
MEKLNLKKILPVLMASLIMGFADIVGVATGYIKNDFGLTDDLAQLIPFMALIWFFFLAVPTGILQDRYGKKTMLNIGTALLGLGMLVPFIHYSFAVMLPAMILMGIGNTIVQVSANPLLMNVVPKDKFSSFMSLSQFLKAISSLLGPIITTFVAIQFGNWKLVFVVYAATSLIAVTWLFFTKIDESKGNEKPATFKSCFSLLKNKFVILMALGIFFLVGADVGMNTNIANYLQSTFSLSLEQASLGISIYFAALMIGRFMGVIILNWLPAKKFLVGTTVIALISMLVMIFAPNVLIARIAIFMVGLGSGNLFPLIFAITLEKMPKRANEISGLMIMAISGGAIIPPIMGLVSTNFGITASLMVLAACLLYILVASLYTLRKREDNGL